jgi:putative helicase MOV10L1/helicase MOV-10
MPRTGQSDAIGRADSSQSGIARGCEEDRRVDGQGSSISLRNDGTAKQFNVFMPSFVSERARNVNREPARLILDTSPANEVDYASYCNQELIPALLRSLPKPEPAYSHQTAFRDNLALRPGSYEHFFRFHLDEEICAQQRENDSHSLYGHDIVVEFAQGLPLGKEEATVTIVVPGMREDTPMIEHDDVLQLR